MERTRHFTATVYLVHDGATALHDHKRLDARLPPGGHVDRGELPHEAALREAEEETGLSPSLLLDQREIRSTGARTVPRPRHVLLEDINVHDGTVGHQHVDLIYYATVDSRTITPEDGEESADAWAWYTPDELARADVAADIAELGREAIETARDGTGT